MPKKELLLELTPPTVTFSNAATQKGKATFQLRNPTEKFIGYRIRTSYSYSFAIQKSHGILSPGDSVTIKVMYRPPKEPQNSFTFLILSTFVESKNSPETDYEFKKEDRKKMEVMGGKMDVTFGNVVLGPESTQKLMEEPSQMFPPFQNASKIDTSDEPEEKPIGVPLRPKGEVKPAEVKKTSLEPTENTQKPEIITPQESRKLSSENEKKTLDRQPPKTISTKLSSETPRNSSTTSSNSVNTNNIILAVCLLFILVYLFVGRSTGAIEPPEMDESQPFEDEYDEEDDYADDF